MVVNSLMSGYGDMALAYGRKIRQTKGIVENTAKLPTNLNIYKQKVLSQDRNTVDGNTFFAL